MSNIKKFEHFTGGVDPKKSPENSPFIGNNPDETRPIYAAEEFIKEHEFYSWEAKFGELTGDVKIAYNDFCEKNGYEPNDGDIVFLLKTLIGIG